jgi:hypothetical protein
MCGACVTNGRQNRFKHSFSGRIRSKEPLEGARLKWKNYSKMDLQEFVWEGMERIDLAWYRDSWRALLNAAMNIWVPYNGGNFLTS